MPDSSYRKREELEVVIAGHFHELFPHYAYSDQLTAVDLMRGEILALRREVDRYEQLWLQERAATNEAGRKSRELDRQSKVDAMIPRGRIEG